MNALLTLRGKARWCARMVCVVGVSGILLLAAVPSWMNKPIADWTEEDARQILSDSPWAKTITAGIIPRESEDARRESGNMGQEHGVGVDGVGKKPTFGEGLSRIFSDKGIHPSQFIALRLRWESAL